MDDVLYISGQIGLNPETGEMVESLEEQTVQSLDNIAQILQVDIDRSFPRFKGTFQLAGATFNNVIKATVFLSDINDFTAVNEIYANYFTENYPARAAIQVTSPSYKQSYTELSRWQHYPRGPNWR